MVVRAQLHEFIEGRAATIGPVFDVMAVQVAGRTAAGKAAALVARGQCAFQCRRDGAGLAADVERLSFGVFNDAYDARVAGQTADGVRCKVWTVVQMAVTIAVKVDQRFRGNVHLHLRVGGAGDGMQQGIGAFDIE